MADGSTLIVGGTGAIGHHAARLLSASGHDVLVSSRDHHRAAVTARQIPGAKPIVIDTSDRQLKLPADVSLVVDCTGTGQSGVGEAAALAGADLIDISATTSHLMVVADLERLFVDADRRVIAGVGLAPGLSTLLARAVHDPERPEPITINGVLDTRDEHGRAPQRSRSARSGPTSPTQ